MTVATALREPTDSHSFVRPADVAVPEPVLDLTVPGPDTDLVPTTVLPGGARPEIWALVERAKTGDVAAFGAIYEQYSDAILRYAYARVRDHQTAEDIVADTFVRAFRHVGTFTWRGRDVGAWLVTIARNLIADHFKSSRYRYESTAVNIADHDDLQPDERSEGNPERIVVDHLTHLATLRAVQQLTPDQRECIVLRFLKGLSVAETARVMGKNEGAIKALQARACNVLARLLVDQTDGRLTARNRRLSAAELIARDGRPRRHRNVRR